MAIVEIFLGDLRGDRPFATLSVPLVWVGQSWERDRALRAAASDDPNILPARTESPYGNMPPSWFGAPTVGAPSALFPLLSRAQQYDVALYSDSEVDALQIEIESLEGRLLDLDRLAWNALAAVLKATSSVAGRRLVMDDV